MAADILALMEARKSQMTKAMRALAQCIAQDTEFAAFCTASQLAEKAQVSPATVVRFAYFLDCDGFPELQNQFASLIRRQLVTARAAEHAGEREGEYKSILYADMRALRESADRMTYGMVEYAARTLASARSVYVLAAKGCRPLTEYLEEGFGNLLPSYRIIGEDDGRDMLPRMAHITREDAVLCLCPMERSQRLSEALQAAVAVRAPVLMLTDSEEDGHADLVLYVRRPGERVQLALPVCLSVLSVVLKQLAELLGRADDFGGNGDEL
ncbi:MAG: MurR/RpiR family transcriptional regulator [Clostridia bacterium]|nr:MurR/RpiR family transcriptional regulator [Clostridia bacterium]